VEVNQSTDGIDQTAAGATQTEAAVDKNDDGNSFENLFDDSTHQFLYATTLKEDGRDIHLGDKLVAILVITVQIGMYAYLMNAAAKDLKQDSVAVTVSHDNCKANTFTDLGCDSADDVYAPLITAVLMFLAFIASDIGGSFELILTGSPMAKVTGVALLVEVLVATLCCAFLGALGSLQSGANAILAAVGVAFIHDLDEKVRLIYKYIPKFKHLIVLIVFAVVLGFASILIVVEGVQNSD